MTLPNFLVIGANKSGTTSIYHYLKQHPDVFMSAKKEPGFFAFWGEDMTGLPIAPHIVNSLPDYEKLFTDVRDERAVGEASSIYYYAAYYSGCIERIKQTIPEAKLVVVLRDPAERAYSAFLNRVAWGYERLSDFSEAIREELALPNGLCETYAAPKNRRVLGHYVRMGFYYRSLKLYFDHFNREQIKVFLYTDLVEDPRKMMKDLFDYLGVYSDFKPDVSVKHNVRNEKAQSLRPNKMRQELVQLYREDTLKLQDLIQRDLADWLRA